RTVARSTTASAAPAMCPAACTACRSDDRARGSGVLRRERRDRALRERVARRDALPQIREHRVRASAVREGDLGRGDEALVLELRQRAKIAERDREPFADARLRRADELSEV